MVRRCWRDFPGATSSSFTPPVDEVGTTDYTCVVTQSGANCSSETDGASIEVLAAPQFVEGPEDQALCLGGEALSFAVDSEQGTGPPSYQWYSSRTSSRFRSSCCQKMSDTGAARSRHPASSPVAGTWYYCVVTLEGGGCSSIQTSSGAVSVVGDPSIGAQPLSLDSLCVGRLFVVAPFGVVFRWSWLSELPVNDWFRGDFRMRRRRRSMPISGYALPGTYTYSVSVSLDGGGLRQRGFASLDG